MATRAVVTEILGERTTRFTWSGLLNGDDGAPIEWAAYADRSVQVLGTFGAGGSAQMEGSNTDGSLNFIPLTDPQGNALTFTSGRIEQLEELTKQVRPHVTAGDGTTNLTVVVLARRGF